MSFQGSLARHHGSNRFRGHLRPARTHRLRAATCAGSEASAHRPTSQVADRADDSRSRRRVLHQACAVSAAWLALAPLAAPAPGAALTLAEVTPPIAPPAPLTPREQQIISIFEDNTYSVVNIFDVTLQAGAPQADVPEGNGTGFVWDTEGHIVTNYHVLGSALARLAGSDGRGIARAAASGRPPAVVARVSLLRADGTQQSYEGLLVGADRARDLAVLKVKAPPEQLRPVVLGRSSVLRVGQQVLAIGNPFGFDHTLTTGVVSGLNRTIQSQVGSLIPGGIQSDAAVNPGNSGGPLLDSAGRVVGVNTAIFTNTGTSAGVSFALPVDTVARVVPQLIARGAVVRPSLNAQVASDAVARKLRVARGALLQGVTAGGAAARAGLLPTRRGLAGIVAGDVITAVDATPIATASDLAAALDQRAVGDSVTLTVERSGEQGAQEMRVPVNLEEER